MQVRGGLALAHVLDGAIAGDGGHGGVADAPGRWRRCRSPSPEGLSGLRVKSVRLRDRARRRSRFPLEEDAPEVTEL